MISNKTSRKGFARMTWALVLALVWAICLSCVSIAASEGKTFTQTVEVTQTVKNNPTKTKYVYVLTPEKSTSPMPEGSKNGTYSFTLNGADKHSFDITFDATKEGNYVYDLTRTEVAPDGEKVTPESHKFGYWVHEDSDGSMVIIPYTCYDNHMVIWDETDDDGNPIGITLVNAVSAEPSGGKDGKDGQDGKDGKDGKDGQSCTCKDNDNNSGCSCGDSKNSDGKCNCSSSCNCSNCQDSKSNSSNSSNSNSNSSSNSGSASGSASGSKSGSSGTSGTTTSNVVTRAVNRVVNTGDPYHVLTWFVLIVASIGGLIAVAIVKRKKEKDENG